MPEIPDLSVYQHCIERRARGLQLQGLRFGSPFLLRTISPRPEQLAGRTLASVGRLGKRLVFRFEPVMLAAVHLMILGRLHWKKPGAALPKGSGLLAMDFGDAGTLMLTESGSKRRAALHLLASDEALQALDRGGLEPLAVDETDFAEALRRERHTLKRALTDPSILAGIGNAYSDEILHAAQLSPMKQTTQLSETEMSRLFAATQSTLRLWSERLQAEADAHGGWPAKVTAFRPDMAVHGRYREPCPVCGAPVQRIVHAENEANYCARCQTEGRLLADRALSKLLHDSWPKRLDD